METEPNDRDITEPVAQHPICGICQFVRVRQDRRWYYSLHINGARGGSLTDAAHARETIKYWQGKGWIQAGK